MDLVLEKKYIVNSESFWNFKGKHEYVDRWLLMGSPIPLLLIWITYLTFILKIGPNYMKTRKPYNLNKILLPYNFSQVILSLYLCIKGGIFIWQNGFIHKTCHTEREEYEKLFTHCAYYYFNGKVSELLDTVFFVLRKKQRQVTFLHVYHHSVMLLGTWAILKYEPDQSILFLGTMNSFVHVVMYTYYGLAVFPSLNKYLWWKKYITSLQLLQFVLIIIQLAVSYRVNACPPSKFVVCFIIANLFLLIYLFGDFYINSYLKGTKTEQVNVEIKSKDDGSLKSSNDMYIGVRLRKLKSIG